MPTDSTNRRKFLQSIGAASAIGMSASIAGCIGDDDDDTDDATGVDDTGDDTDEPDELGDPVPEIEMLAPTSGVNAFRNELAGLIADNWRELGFEVTIEELEFGAHVDRLMVQQDFDTSILGWGGTPERIDPDIFIRDMHHSDNSGEGQRNSGAYSNSEYDEIADEQVVTVDEEERQSLVYEAQEILAQDQPRTFIANEGGFHPYASARVDNIDPTLGEGLNSFWNMISAEPTDDDTLRFGYPSEIISLNPMEDLATPDRQFVRLIYDQMYRLGPDGLPQPWLAVDDPVIEDDGLTYTVEIRDDHSFHDGEPLTMDDVEFTLDLYHDSTTYAHLVERIDEYNVSGNEITFHLTEQFAPFTANVLGQLYIFPEHIWGEADRDNLGDFEDPDWIGSGPFQLDAWERQTELQLSAFQDHFEAPNADRFIRIPGADVAQQVNDLEAGQLDMVGAVPQPAAISRVEEDPDLDTAPFEAIGYVMVDYNMRREPFDETPVRRALSYGVPKEDYVQIVRDGMGTITHSTISEHNEFWHNPDVEEFYEDLDAARDELSSAGYGWDDDGRIHYGAE